VGAIKGAIKGAISVVANCPLREVSSSKYEMLTAPLALLIRSSSPVQLSASSISPNLDLARSPKKPFLSPFRW